MQHGLRIICHSLFALLRRGWVKEVAVAKVWCHWDPIQAMGMDCAWSHCGHQWIDWFRVTPCQTTHWQHLSDCHSWQTNHPKHKNSSYLIQNGTLMSSSWLDWGVRLAAGWIVRTHSPHPCVECPVLRMGGMGIDDALENHGSNHIADGGTLWWRAVGHCTKRQNHEIPHDQPKCWRQAKPLMMHSKKRCHWSCSKNNTHNRSLQTVSPSIPIWSALESDVWRRYFMQWRFS